MFPYQFFPYQISLPTFGGINIVGLAKTYKIKTGLKIYTK